MAATSLGRVAVVLLLSSALAPAAAQQRPEGVMSDAIAQRVIAAWGAQRVVIIVKVSDAWSSCGARRSRLRLPPKRSGSRAARPACAR